MCGIAGYFAYRSGGRAVAEQHLLAAREAMHKRGPDGAGIWWDQAGRVGLAHRRLAIIDLEDRALQPMHAPDGALSIVFNGEIYNYRELRAELMRDHGFEPRTESDTEVLLALFAAHGPAMLERLRGMFAMAIWDPAQQRMFLARDPYGIKPLYYADQGGALHFASQVKALLQFPSLSKDTDPAGMVGFRIFGSVPEPFTLYRAIRALPAGSYLWADGQGAGEPVRYASIAADLAEAVPATPRDLQASVREALLDSVKAHLVADVEVGAFLSSGIDSGALVGLMRDAGQSRIRAITLGFEELQGTAADEVPLARRVAQQYGAEHHVRTITAGDFANAADQILEDMDQPSVDGVNSWFVSRAAHECGLKVVVSGLGGDELLAGYSTFRTVPQLRRWGPATRLPFARAFARLMLRRFAGDALRRNPKMLGLLDYDGSWEAAYLLRRAVMLPFELEGQLDPALAREGLERLDALGIVRTAITPKPGGPVATVSALESSLYMRNQLLRDSDWASMAHSLELRVPLVDRRLLRTLAPWSAHFAGGVGKRTLAGAPSLPLPPESLSRGRTGFTIPVATWIGARVPGAERLGSRNWAGQVTKAFGFA